MRAGRQSACAIVLALCACTAQGCELVADFDRSKIPGPDASLDARVSFPDPSDEDAGATDAGPIEAGSDASLADDAGAEDGG